MPIIENLAEVTKRQGNKLRLMTTSPSGCERCDRGEGCGGGVFGKLIQRRLSGLLLTDPGLHLEPGQIVVLGVDSNVLLRATLITYLMPLLLLLIFAVIAQALGVNDGIVAVCGLAGLLGGAVLAPRFRQRYMDAGLQPQIMRRAGVSDLRVCQ